MGFTASTMCCACGGGSGTSNATNITDCNGTSVNQSVINNLVSDGYCNNGTSSDCYSPGSRVEVFGIGLGVIQCIDQGEPPVLVCFDAWSDGHDGNGLCGYCPGQSGWYVYYSEIECVSNYN